MIPLVVLALGASASAVQDAGDAPAPEATPDEIARDDEPSPEEEFDLEDVQEPVSSGLSEADIDLDGDGEGTTFAPDATEHDTPWYERWPGGWRLEHSVVRDSGKEASYLATLNGLLQVDGLVVDDRGPTEVSSDGLEIRRGRIVARGVYSGWMRASYMLQFGFDTPNWLVHDAFVALHSEDSRRTFQFGHFRMPMTLSGRESGRDLIMLERPAVVTSFWPNRRLGAQIASSNAERTLTWRAGVFSLGVEDSDDSGSETPLQASGRVTGIPHLVGDASAPEQMVQLGLSGLWQFSNSSVLRYRARPESRLAPFLVDTGELDSRQAFTLGGEVAAQSGPVSIALEYLRSFVDGDEKQLQFDGAYVTGSWLLTGERRRFNPSLAVWGRLRPAVNMEGGDNRIGALQAVVHASYLDLRDGAVDGGRMDILGAGLNWYWNPAVSFQVNTLLVDVTGGPSPGESTLVEGRLQFAF